MSMESFRAGICQILSKSRMDLSGNVNGIIYVWEWPYINISISKRPLWGRHHYVSQQGQRNLAEDTGHCAIDIDSPPTRPVSHNASKSDVLFNCFPIYRGCKGRGLAPLSCNCLAIFVKRVGVMISGIFWGYSHIHEMGRGGDAHENGRGWENSCVYMICPLFLMRK